ncbi:MAG TPA: glycosyltransferase family 2 protein [Chitinophagaceae bacterium]|nr:glycosyltransferase family 2 protein [Chitinophagaceae bacterium]
MSTPSIAVVVLNWNGLEDTLACLASLYRSEQPNVFIYVLDNGSANEEASVLREKFPEARVLIEPENTGFCRGNNIALQRAIADGMEYLLLLNNDTIVPADMIGHLLDVFKKIPDVGALCPLVLEYPGVDTISFSRATWDHKTAKFLLKTPGDTREDLEKKDYHTTAFACGCCLFTSAKIWQEMGGFDERYFAYYEEAEWCVRLAKKGYKSYMTPRTIVYHRVARNTPGVVSIYLMTRNRLLWMKSSLSFGKRLKSYPYLMKELLWHLFHTWGITKGYYTRASSQAVVRGWKDYLGGRFGKWNKKTEQMLFKKNS